MNYNSIRIVFMGTPEFAVAPLAALVEAGIDVAAIVTAPDKPAGRGKKLTSPAVKQYADANLSCPVLQPEKLREPDFVDQLRGFKADIFVVVAFRMLPEVVWSIPSLGTINLHASLLPQYRGAAPINWAIINGEKETGLTTFIIDHEIDKGNVLLLEKVEIEASDNAGTLHDKLMETGAWLLVKTVTELAAGSLEPVEQTAFHVPEEQLKKAPKIFREDCRIHWERPALEIHNLVRGLSPYPGAFSEFADEDGESFTVKIFETGISQETAGTRQKGSTGTGQDDTPEGTSTADSPVMDTGNAPGALQSGESTESSDTGNTPGSKQIDDSLESSGSGFKPGIVRSDNRTFISVATADGWLEIKQLQLPGKRKMSAEEFLRGNQSDVTAWKVI